MFFDDYPAFNETSRTAASPARLNLRHEAMIEPNRDILAGARVLDLASHDGRWSFAAHKAGAAHVTGVEARRPMVEAARKTFAAYGVPSDRYTFIRGDLFKVLDRRELDVDVVMCLGFLYHTLRYGELLQGIRRTGARWLLVDTKVTTDAEPTIRVNVNPTRRTANAANDALSNRGQALAGWPSVPALRLMLDVYDYDVEDEYDWPSRLASRDPELVEAAGAYAKGNRVTMRCRARQ
ncbi:MAG TPA: methyltransferase domain-containing protein [Marmoricola sp.]|nr:methyltransferase domain-containing protein [Marmoricola sp.]